MSLTNFFTRIIKLAIGIVLYAIGISLSVNANIGLAPWDALSMGISLNTKISFGTAGILIGFAIIIVDLFLKEKIGIGTLSNMVFIGLLINVFEDLKVIPVANNLYVGIIMLLTGQTIICLGTYFYISAAFGAGPRDSFMIALNKIMPNVPIGVIRSSIEGTVLFVGWFLGAPVGIGTIISVFGMGIIIQMVFRLFKFDIKTVEHQSVKDLFVNLQLSFVKK